MRTFFRAGWLVAACSTLMRLLGAVLPFGALWSLANALMALPSAAQARLFGPYFHIAFPVPGIPTDLLPMAAAWPAAYVWEVIQAALPGRTATLAPAEWTVAAIVFAAAANLAGYLAQDERNRAALAGVALWGLSLTLNLGDLIATAALPSLWHATSGAAPGAWVRVGEMTSSIALLTVWAPVRFNRVRPDIFISFSEIMGPVRRGLTWWTAVGMLVLPMIANHFGTAFMTQIVHGHDAAEITEGWAIIAGLAFLAWVLVLGGIWRTLEQAFGLVSQLLMSRPVMGGLPGRQMPPAARRHS